MDCYFRQSWRDSRLSFLGPIKSLSLSIKMLERIWRPDTYFYNGKHSYVHTITVPNKLLRISQDGDILYSMRFVRAWIYALCGKSNPISPILARYSLDFFSSSTFAKKDIRDRCRSLILYLCILLWNIIQKYSVESLLFSK